jgi:hypothetical protein
MLGCQLLFPCPELILFIPGRFLPPPIPLFYSPDGLKAPERSDFQNHKFPSLFFSLNPETFNQFPSSSVNSIFQNTAL